MIGTNLSLILPGLGDVYSVAIAKTATALSQIQASIADKATPAALTINTALDFGGNAITNCTSLQLASGNTPGVAGSLFYYQGEFYAIDATGTIQMTANGQLNAASIGGIGGDYGGVNPAKVTYDNASGQYRFTRSPGVWADLVAANLILQGSSATLTVGVDSGLAASRILKVKSLPSSGVGLVVYNSATSTIEDAALTPPGATTFTGAVTATDYKHTTARLLSIPAAAAKIGSGGPGASFGSDGNHWDNISTSRIVFPITLKVGDIIGGFTVYLNKTGASTTVTARLYRWDQVLGSEIAMGTGVTVTGNVGLTPLTEAVTATIQQQRIYYLVVTDSSATTSSGDSVFGAEVSFTR